MAKKTETKGRLTMGQLKKRWKVNGVPLYRLLNNDPDFPKPVGGLASVFNISDVERYEQTRTLTLRFNCFIAALERELEGKVDFATWARAVTAAKKKIPEWGELVRRTKGARRRRPLKPTRAQITRRRAR